jgi:integrase
MTKRRTRGQNEGSIYQRASDGKWVAAVDLGWKDGKRQRKCFYGATRAEVADKLTAALAEKKRGRPIKPEKQTFGTYLERWFAEVVLPNRRPNTIRTYRYFIDQYIVPELGDIPLGKLTPQDVQRLLASLRTRGLAANTRANVLSVLRLALGRAERWELVPRNVAKLVDRPRVHRHEPFPLTPAEAGILLSTVAGDRLAALYELSIRLGPRQGEALGIRWRDVDLAAGTLAIRHQLQRVDGAWQFAPLKTERSRRILELSPLLVAALTAHRDLQHDEREIAGYRWQDWDLVFCSMHGAPLWGSHLCEHLAGQLAAAGLPRRRWHDLRHTAVTLMLAAGVPERTIMDIVGHSSIDMTRLYGAILPPSRQDAAARVDALIGASQSEWLHLPATAVTGNGHGSSGIPHDDAEISENGHRTETVRSLAS